jgi:hypothetical protein
MSACYWYRSLARTFKSAPLFYAAYNDSLPIPNVGMLRDIRRIPFPSSGVLLQTLEGLASKDETKKIPLQNCRAVGWIGRKRNPPFFSVGRRIMLSLIRPALCNIYSSIHLQISNASRCRMCFHTARRPDGSLCPIRNLRPQTFHHLGSGRLRRCVTRVFARNSPPSCLR